MVPFTGQDKIFLCLISMVFIAGTLGKRNNKERKTIQRQQQNS